MPELPEVETVVRQLRAVLPGAVLKKCTVRDPLLKFKPGRGLCDRRVKDVLRLGKQIILDLAPRETSSSDVFIAIHLRMTGRLLWQESGAEPRSKLPRTVIRTGPSEKSRASFVFDRGELSFVDCRRFGTIARSSSLAVFAPQGLDPFAADFTVELLGKMLCSSHQPLKNWLLRQDRLVGIGNIYAAEILHLAHLSPLRAGISLSSAEIKIFHRAILSILRRAIAHAGTTFSDFRHSTGEMGRFQRLLKVYNREGQPCRACRAPIVRIVQQGRSTYYCPSCQT